MKMIVILYSQRDIKVNVNKIWMQCIIKTSNLYMNSSQIFLPISILISIENKVCSLENLYNSSTMEILIPQEINLINSLILLEMKKLIILEILIIKKFKITLKDPYLIRMMMIKSK